jgi:hypothetical protein
MYLREVEVNGRNWIDLVQDTDQWRALVNTVMIPHVPSNAGAHVVAFQEGFGSMKLGSLLRNNA